MKSVSKSGIKLTWRTHTLLLKNPLSLGGSSGTAVSKSAHAGAESFGSFGALQECCNALQLITAAELVAK